MFLFETLYKIYHRSFNGFIHLDLFVLCLNDEIGPLHIWIQLNPQSWTKVLGTRTIFVKYYSHWFTPGHPF